MELSRRLFKFGYRIDTLVDTINEHDHGSSLTPSAIFIVERSLIQLQIEWELFVRNLVLDSATGRYSDRSGRIVSSLSVRLPTRELASHFLVSQYKKRQVEPDWYLPSDAILAAAHLKLSNLSNISANLGLTPWEIDDLRYVRNFIAHRSKRSALKMRQKRIISSSGVINPISSAFSFGPSGVKNYRVWAQFIKFVAGKLAT